ncbi:MAG: hypothetical protein RL522_700 [Pseudomonadota bacterium]|jgi:cytochrome c-type biogenesis protein CcmH/NrfG
MPRTEVTVLYLLAFVMLKHARPQSAATLLEALDLLEPGQARTLMALATAQVRCGRARQALATLDRCRRAGGDTAPIELLRSQAFGILHRHAEAAAALRIFLQQRIPPATGASTGT